jgi:hypothetical protein
MECSSSSSLLLALPPEILAMIFDQAPLVDRAMLAMSCKSMLEIGRLCSLSVPDHKHHRAPWSITEVDKSVDRCSCMHMEELLRRFQPRDANGRPRRAWSWCVDCSMYQPTRRGWWMNKIKKTWSKEKLSSATQAIDWYSRGVKRQCPSCWLRESGA